MTKRIFLIVLDSFGIGHAPDAAEYSLHYEPVYSRVHAGRIEHGFRDACEHVHHALN